MQIISKQRVKDRGEEIGVERKAKGYCKKG